MQERLRRYIEEFTDGQVDIVHVPAEADELAEQLTDVLKVPQAKESLRSFLKEASTFGLLAVVFIIDQQAVSLNESDVGDDKTSEFIDTSELKPSFDITPYFFQDRSVDDDAVTQERFFDSMEKMSVDFMATDEEELEGRWIGFSAGFVHFSSPAEVEYDLSQFVNGLFKKDEPKNGWEELSRVLDRDSSSEPVGVFIVKVDE